MNKITQYIRRKILLLIIIGLLIINLIATYYVYDSTFVIAKDQDEQIVRIPMKKAFESIIVGEQQLLAGLKQVYTQCQPTK